MVSSSSDQRVLWPQVWGIALVQGAISLCWVIYNLYLIDLLTQLGFAASLATGLLILENGLGIVMEPLMGNFSDRAQQWLGSRFPFIAIGTIVASVCFLLIPLVAGLSFVVPLDVLLSGAWSFVRFGLPFILVAWALSMTTFRSPALSLLSRYAYASQLPSAASILTLVGGLAGAMGPLASQFILGLGAFPAFTVGSIVLLVAATVLRSTKPNQSVTDTVNTPEQDPNPTPVADGSLSFLGLALIFGSGVGVSLGFRLMMQTLPTILNTQVDGANVGLIMGGIFLALAATAIPAGSVGTRIGNRLAMLLGLSTMAGLLILTVMVQSVLLAILIALGLGGAYSLVSNGVIPFALSLVPPSKAGLGTGLYFSGGAAASSLFGLIFSNPDAFTPVAGVLMGAAGFGLSGVCILISNQVRLSDPLPAEV